MRKKEKALKTPAPKLFESRLSPMLIAVAGAVWLYMVLVSYYKANPFNSGIFETYASLSQFGIPLGLHHLSVALVHLVVLVPAVLILFAGYGAGCLVVPFFKLQDTSSLEYRLFATATGTGTVILSIFVLGICGVLYPVTVWGVIILFDVYAVRCLFGGTGKDASPVPRLTFPVLRGFEKIWILLAICFALIVLAGAVAPETFYDSAVYHLAKPNFWIQSHRIVPDEAKLITAFYPGNINVLYVAGLMANGNGAVAKCIHFLFTFLTCGVVYAMGKRFSGRGAGLLGAMLFLTVPYIGVVSYRSVMEMPLAFFETLAVFSLVRWMADKDRKWLIMAGIQCGLGLGTKYTSFYCLVSLLGALVLDAVVNKRSFRATITATALLSGVAISVSLPWWIYNYVYSGNPLYPFFWKYMGHLRPRISSDAALRIVSAGRWSKIIDVIKGPWTITMGQYEEAFIGPALLLFAPLFLLIKSRWKPVKSLFVYVALYWIIWGVAHEMYVRYFLPAIPLVCFLCAIYVYESPLPRYARSIVFSVLTFVMLGNLAFVMNLQKASNNCLGVVLGFESEADYLNRSRMTYPNPYYDAASWINAHTPRNAGIALVGEQRSLYIERKSLMMDFSNYSPMIVWAEEAKDGEELFAKLRQKGITHLLLNVPEARRLTVLDPLNFEAGGLRNFGLFWEKHVREVYSAIGDNEIASQGIFSTRMQLPEWWSNFSSNRYNHVYVYEIVSRQNDNKDKGRSIPFNFLMTPQLYAASRWGSLEPVAKEYWQRNPPPTIPIITSE
jgi:hypothetical protein